MAIINPGDTPLADQARNKLGQTSVYGCRVYGGFQYGEDVDIYGIYKIIRGVVGQIIVKTRFYIPNNPRTIPQQLNRQKYTDSILVWQNLTEEQKSVYNNRVKGQKLSGYNLFIKEYLLSH